MASLKDLMVTGPARFLDKIYGNLEGTATALTTSAGSASRPIYFKDGKPAVITSLGVGETSDSTDRKVTTYRKASDDDTYAATSIGISSTSLSTSWVYNHFDANGTRDKQISIVFNDVQFRPSSNETVNLGESSFKWATVYANTFSGNLSGNATTATYLKGAKPEVVPVTTLTAGYMRYFYNVGRDLTGNMPLTNNANGILQLNTHSGEYNHQLGFSSNNKIYHRCSNGSALTNSTTWNEILTSANYNDYTVKKDGTGATGDWGINITGNAATATKLATARTLTIGNTGKSFDGSNNVSWTLSEIGALAHIIKTGTLDLDTFTSTGYYTVNSSTLTNHPETGHGIMFVDYNVGTPVQFYMHDTSFTLYKRHRNNTTGGWNAWSSTLGNSISGNAATATKLATARTLTIGNSGKTFDGSNNVSWNLHDILNISSVGTSSSWDIINPGIYYVSSGSAFTGTGNPESANGGLTPYRYGHLLVSRAGNGGMAQFYISHTDSSNSSYGIKFRTGWNSSYVATWSTLLDSTNYTNYTVKKDGTGATGNWGINAATATKLATARTLTVGNSEKSFDGSGNVSWSLSEIGAMATDGSTYQVALTGGDDNTTGYRLIGQASIAAWNNRRLSFIVTSRHTGNGLVTINYGCNNGTVTTGTIYCHIKYFGISESTSGSPVSTDSFTARASSDGTTMYFFWRYHDYNGTYITVLGNSGAFTPSNGTWTLDPSTYGALIASTQVNVADSLASTLALNKGGTGATTKTGAKTNLGITYGTALPTSGMSEGDIFLKIG